MIQHRRAVVGRGEGGTLVIGENGAAILILEATAVLNRQCGAGIGVGYGPVAVRRVSTAVTDRAAIDDEGGTVPVDQRGGDIVAEFARLVVEDGVVLKNQPGAGVGVGERCPVLVKEAGVVIGEGGTVLVQEIAANGRIDDRSTISVGQSRAAVRIGEQRTALIGKRTPVHERTVGIGDEDRGPVLIGERGLAIERREVGLEVLDRAAVLHGERTAGIGIRNQRAIVVQERRRGAVNGDRRPSLIGDGPEETTVDLAAVLIQDRAARLIGKIGWTEQIRADVKDALIRIGSRVEIAPDFNCATGGVRVGCYLNCPGATDKGKHRQASDRKRNAHKAPFVHLPPPSHRCITPKYPIIFASVSSRNKSFLAMVSHA